MHVCFKCKKNLATPLPVHCPHCGHKLPWEKH